jgi:hypothetical protein
MAAAIQLESSILLMKSEKKRGNRQARENKDPMIEAGLLVTGTCRSVDLYVRRRIAFGLLYCRLSTLPNTLPFLFARKMT